MDNLKFKMLPRFIIICFENMQKDELLKKLWVQECEKRTKVRNEYLDSIVNNEKNKSKKYRNWAFVLLFIFIIIILCVYVFVPEGSMSIIDKFLSNKLVSIGVSIFVGLILCGWNFYAWQNYYNWCINLCKFSNK